jgi:GntR family transcriptional regulator
VAGSLRERITLGEYGATGALESEAALARRYDTSRVTIRRALEALRDEGLLVSRKGSGWFVAADPVREILGVLPSATRALTEAGITVTREVLEFGFAAPPEPTAAALGLSPDTQALRAKRLHRADGTPYDLITTWLAPHIAGAVSRDELQQLGAWETLRAHGVEPVHTFHSITAGAATPDQANSLELTPGSPLLLLRRLATTADHTPVAISNHRYAAHHIRIDIEFHGEPSLAAAEPPGLRLIAPHHQPA